jgi:hypothetical protein
MNTFAERHAAVEKDTLAELKRRTQMWASAPGENGGILLPDAQIVPVTTILAAIKEIEDARRGSCDPAEVQKNKGT